mmetsp:Transcript_7438/g.19078  ORF Transcript_7438/g.19078 Transcript_7438/m.19078 type:complete len:221 (+) Transcript_7438:400-1062(+)
MARSRRSSTTRGCCRTTSSCRTLRASRARCWPRRPQRRVCCCCWTAVSQYWATSCAGSPQHWRSAASRPQARRGSPLTSATATRWRAGVASWTGAWPSWPSSPWKAATMRRGAAAATRPSRTAAGPPAGAAPSLPPSAAGWRRRRRPRWRTLPRGAFRRSAWPPRWRSSGRCCSSRRASGPWRTRAARPRSSAHGNMGKGEEGNRVVDAGNRGTSLSIAP